MAKLPDETAIAAPAFGPSNRPIASYDATGYARGAAALGQGAENLGAGLTKAGKDVAVVDKERQADDDKLEVARAKSDFLTKKVELDATLPDETDHETLPGRYSAKLGEIQQSSAANITNPRTRELFTLSTNDDIARGNALADRTANKLWADATVADTMTRLEQVRQAALQSADPEDRKRLIETGNDLIGSLAAKNIVSQEWAAAKRQEWTTKYAAGAIAMLPPEDRVRVLGGFEGALAKRESGGNPASVNQFGYAGLYQFGAPRLADMGVYTPGPDENLKTWSKTGKDAPGKWSGTFDIPGHPEISSIDDFLASPDAQRAAFQVHGGKMDKEIAASGFDQYIGQNVGGVNITREGLHAMMHLGGVNGTRKALEGRGDAADANGTSVLEYAKLGNQSDLTRVATLLPEDTRVRMLNQAQTQADQDSRKRYADAMTGFKSRWQDTVAEAMNTGTVTKPMTQDEFVAVHGPEDGPKQFQSYTAQLQLGADVNRIADLGPDEQDKLLATYAPRPGSEGYAEQVTRFDALQKAVGQVSIEKGKDPAAFAIRRLPMVQEAYQNFSTAASNAAVPLEQKQAAAREFAIKMDLEQARIGVPPEMRKLLPQDYVDHFNKSVTAAADSEDPQKRIGLVAQIHNEAQIWGDAWPQVMRQMAPTAQPMVRAIAAGADTVAMTRLLSLPHDEAKRPSKILSQQSETKYKDVLSDLNTSMASYRGTLLPSQRDRDFSGYYNLGTELAALYVRDGDEANVAATKAFGALIGNRYEFRDTFRVPKDSAVSADLVQAGAQAARSQLGKLGAQPFKNDVGLEDNAGDSLSKFARDGKWITSDRNDGLNLYYYSDRGPIAVRGADGQPLLLPWSRLSDLAKTEPFYPEPGTAP